MKNRQFSIALIFGLLAGAVACSHAPARSTVPPVAQIPVRDFFRNPDRTRVMISPNGRQLAFLAPVTIEAGAHRMNIFVQALDKNGAPKGEARQITHVTDRDISDYFWKGEKTVLFLKDFGGDENFHLFKTDIATGKSTDLTPYEKVRAEMIDTLDYIDDGAVLVSLNRKNPEVFDVYRVNVRTGKLALVAENPGNITGWINDQRGKVLAAVSTDGLNSTIYSRKSEKDKFAPIQTFDYQTSISPLFFSDRGDILYASSNLGRDKQAIVELDPATGKELKVLFEHPEVDAERAEYSRHFKRLLDAPITTWKDDYHFFDAQAEKRYQQIAAQLPGTNLGYNGHDRSETRFVVHAGTDRSRPKYYIWDDKTGKLSFLFDSSPWLDPSKLAEMHPVSYNSRDGLKIQAYVTLPVGVTMETARNLPVVVNPHGGPWARDEWRFDPEVQLLANRGYAVLQMNFRGSTGYGREFWKASFKQWGKKMQDDVSDGVKWLESKGIADPKRVAIYGGSYGGYATLAGLAFSPELYACGIDYVGVSNLFTFMKSIPPYWKPYLATMYAMVGDPEKDADLMKAASPVFHADQIRAPLLVAQGARDPRVNKNESDQIVNSLKKRGIDVPYLVKENEGHGFHNEENRFEFYEAMEGFLNKHL